MIDWMVVWTAVGAGAAVAGVIVTLTIFIVKRIREGDLKYINGLKSDTDNQISNLRTSVERSAVELHNKLDKSEFQSAQSRIDRDMSELKQEQKSGFSEVRQDIKELRDDLLDKIIELIKR